MEQKYPIQFSLGQFVILFGVVVLLLGSSFFLGARFGDKIFPGHDTKGAASSEPYLALQPQTPLAPSRLMGGGDLHENAEAPSQEGDSIPHFQADANGVLTPQEPHVADQPWADQDLQAQTPPAFVPTAADKHTVVRFKSSGFSKFSVEVSEYFDELLAAQRIRHLKEQGYEAYLHIENPGSRAPTFVVRVGAFAERGQAEAFATQMSNQEELELRVVRVN